MKVMEAIETIKKGFAYRGFFYTHLLGSIIVGITLLMTGPIPERIANTTGIHKNIFLLAPSSVFFFFLIFIFFMEKARERKIESKRSKIKKRLREEVMIRFDSGEITEEKKNELMADKKLDEVIDDYKKNS